MILTATHSHGHIQAASAKGQHADAAAGGRVAVGADQGFTGNSKALQVDLMANAVAGPGVIDAMFFCYGLNVTVVIGVFKAALQCIMVNVGHTALCFYPWYAHGLKLQIGHGSRGVLGQSLVDAQADILAHIHLAADQMVRNDFLCDCLAHDDPPCPRLK